MARSEKFSMKLGMFVLAGSLLFIIAIFLIGRQRNLFNPVFRVSTTFSNVSGLQVGNNVRFAGINVGTVENIIILNDSTVQVDMFIRSGVKQFIKSDCIVTIGSEGIIGDRLLTIMHGSSNSPFASDGQFLLSKAPVETNDLMNRLHATIMNTQIISGELAQIMADINNGNGTIGRLIQDSATAWNLDEILNNLRSSSSGLNENMKAAKGNILLRGYFRKKEREAAKKKETDNKIKEAKPRKKK